MSSGQSCLCTQKINMCPLGRVAILLLPFRVCGQFWVVSNTNDTTTTFPSTEQPPVDEIMTYTMSVSTSTDLMASNTDTVPPDTLTTTTHTYRSQPPPPPWEVMDLLHILAPFSITLALLAATIAGTVLLCRLTTNQGYIYRLINSFAVQTVPGNNRHLQAVTHRANDLADGFLHRIRTTDSHDPSLPPPPSLSEINAMV